MSLTVKIRGDASHFDKTIKGVTSKVKSYGGALKAVGMGVAGAGAAIAAAGAAAGALAYKITLIGEAANTSRARLNQIVKSMGTFGDESGIVSERISKLADDQARLLGVDNQTIRMTQSKLATFKELLATADETGGAFDRATMAAINMAAAGFGEAEQNAVQLGKALNDPIKGITSLARSGITFTAQEKEKAKALVESNQMLKAQDMILGAIEKQVGGAAAATADGTARMKESFAQLIQAFAMPFSQAFQNLPMMMEGGFESMRDKASTFGGVFKVAIEDSFKGEYDGLVKIGMGIAQAIGAGLKAGLKIAFYGASQSIMEGIENINPLRKLDMFKDSGKLSEQLKDTNPEIMQRAIEDAVTSARDAFNALSAPVGVTPAAQRLFDQGVRAGDPGYGGTEMSKMLETLERIARAVDKPFPN
jgi:hypothetical protein